MVTTTAQLQSTTPELRFCPGSNSALGVSKIRDGEDLWQWSRLKIRLNACRRSTIPQKHFIIIYHDPHKSNDNYSEGCYFWLTVSSIHECTNNIDNYCLYSKHRIIIVCSIFENIFFWFIDWLIKYTRYWNEPLLSTETRISPAVHHPE